MKTENRNQSGTGTGDRGQLILIGGLVVAVAVVAIALVIGGGIFSQSTTDDGGLSSFASETADQVQTAAAVGQQDVEFVNENSTLLGGAYPDEICGKLVNSTKVQQLVATQLGEGESVAEIEVKGDCGVKSWVVGQRNPGYNLPSVNATSTSGKTVLPADVVFAIDTTGSMGDLSVYSGDFVNKPWETPPHSGNFPRDVYRPRSDVPIREDWLDVQKLGSWTPGGSPSGDMVYDDSFGVNEMARVTSSSPTGTECDGFLTGGGSCIFGSFVDTWGVEYRTGGTDDVVVTEIKEVRYKLEEKDCVPSCTEGVPERIWFTQKGLMAAVDDLNKTLPDRAGLIEYDTTQSELKEVRGVNDVSHRDDLKDEAAQLTPSGGTNITGGLDRAKTVLEDNYGIGPDASTDATKNIVLMTDGNHNEGPPGPVTYINNNNGDFDDTYIHSVVLGSSAADDPGAVGDMAELANDPDPDLSSSALTDSDLPSCCDPVRPEGTLIASNDPSDAEDIFEDIVGNIEDTSITSQSSGTGKVDEIQDIRMNVTNFRGNGTYRMKFENGSTLVWEMVVDNKYVFPGNPSPGEGYEVRFRSGLSGPISDDLNQTLTVTTPPDRNLSDSGEYVWVDLTGKGSKQRLEVGGLSDVGSELSGYSDPDSYMEDAWQEVKSKAESDGVDIVFDHKGPNGPDDAPFRRGEVNGSFSLEFIPEDGDFTNIEQISGGNFTDDCDAANETDLPARCGLNDPGNERDAVSSTQIKEVKLRVKVEGPEGISEREITISPSEDFDIFDP